MQGDSAEADPRLEKTEFGPKVATGYVDPCLVFLETTLPGKIPLLAACWAASACESRISGARTRLKLDDVWVFKFERMPSEREGALTRQGKPVWHVSDYQDTSLLLTALGSEFSVQTVTGDPLLSFFQPDSHFVFRGSVRFLDQKTDASLRDLLRAKTNTHNKLAKKILECATVDWSSIAEAMASLETNKPPQDRTLRALITHHAALKQKQAELEQRRLSIAEALLQAQPNDGVFHYYLGDSFYEAGEYQRATEELQQALKHPGVRYEALNKMGLCFMMRGMFDFAVKQLALAESELSAMDGLKKEIVYNLGLAYEASKQPEKSLDQWKKIFEVDMSYRDVATRVESAYGVG